MERGATLCERSRMRTRKGGFKKKVEAGQGRSFPRAAAGVGGR